MQIASAANNEYLPHLAAMLHSLFETNNPRAIHLHLLHRPDQARTAERVKAMCEQYGAGFRSREVDPKIVSDLGATERYPPEAWYRLLLPGLLPDVPRVLWLDADLLILGSLDELWSMPLDGKCLAAVPNALGPAHRSIPQRLGMPSGTWNYFNTGVMLMDTARMREQGAEQRLREAAGRLRSLNVFADQDVFNPVFASDFKALPLQWNVTAGAFIYAAENSRVHGFGNYRRAVHAPRIVHFTLHKPWRYGSSHPYRDAYLRHRRAAGWPDPVESRRTWHRVARHLPMSWRAAVRHPGALSIADMAFLAAIWALRPRLSLQRFG